MWNGLLQIEKLYIAGKLLNKTSLDLIIEGYAVSEDMLAVAREYLVTHKPLSKIFNEKWFYKQKFFTNEYTLDPRPETELIVDLVLEKYTSHLQFLELGVGTGAISLSILDNLQNARFVVTDICERAIEVAKQNAHNLRLTNRITFLQADWLNMQIPKNCILVSNPPYLSQVEVNQFPNLKFDPLIALIGDIKTYYLPIAKNKIHFKAVILEIHPDFADKLKALFPGAIIHKDLSGKNRILEWINNNFL